jgi:hypothetical protein
MRTLIQGTLTEAFPIEEKDTYKKQQITLIVQEYDRDTGEPKKREVFQPVIFNKHIESCRAKELIGKRVIATCWIRSYEVTKDDKTFYNLNLNCSELKEA